MYFDYGLLVHSNKFVLVYYNYYVLVYNLIISMYLSMIKSFKKLVYEFLCQHKIMPVCQIRLCHYSFKSINT